MESNEYIKYTKEPELSIVAEPMAAYYTPRVHVGMLAGISYSEILSTHISGRDLLRLQDQLSLTPQALADVMGISKSKYYDLLKQESLEAYAVDALADFAKLWQLGLSAFDDDRSLFLEWLSTRNENLGGVQPISLIATRVGRRALERAFLRIEHSTYG